MLICIGGVCIPIHLLLAFAVAWAHRHGYLLFLKEEWFTYRYWKGKVKEALNTKSKELVKDSNNNDKNE